ncbi:ferrous iron transport protein A [Clostridium thermosuccinogenes]|jgi:ferrous iron transport protein A|uniref:Ferrous iron transport protein A n=1 Tax=Clostridium thermosuccinogenes TaxID=84032 RepID=A0A2K2FFS0_9CLOT|nr:ferrous iron transport protein A [Pseudoclostridium thermosuccinogenes]AUS96711.1 ferrous iron transport protein A [Pseudoclostridium thermosuccinogenes]PNT92627.1 ferrous iron transport protein A [Pseudoclostridium thermosuccinogenes]PNT97635.1 ferrous iron transport protein A [Pseudoclostridium thermosuccinogenes]PNU00528.1 ferrous iron transport protein A [Pseudoclostridium thermosuccinogenes]
MSINDLKTGQSAVIHAIGGNPKLAKRLKALGYIEGTRVTVRGSAPLGDPIIIKLRGFDIALRRKDAEFIKVREG